MDLAQLADRAVVNPGLDGTNKGAIAGGQKMGGDLGFARGLDDYPGLVDAVGQGLVHEDVLAFLHRGHGDGRVEMIGCHDFDRVQVFFLFEQLAKIGISGAALKLFRALLLCVNGLDEFLGNVASSRDARRAAPPFRLAHRAGDRRAHLVPGPVHIFVAVLDRIASRDDLDLRHRKHGDHLAQSLRAAADVGHSDFLAGRDKPRSSEHVSRHNAEGRGGRAAREHELAARKAHWLRLGLRLDCFPGR